MHYARVCMCLRVFNQSLIPTVSTRKTVLQKTVTPVSLARQCQLHSRVTVALRGMRLYARLRTGAPTSEAAYEQ